MRARFRRRLIALVAAYAVALDALLPALAMAASVPAEAVPAVSIVCSSAGTVVTPYDGSPSERGTICPHGVACLASSCGAVAAVVGRLKFAQALGPGAAPVSFPFFASRDTDGRQVFTPHFARGPPLV